MCFRFTVTEAETDINRGRHKGRLGTHTKTNTEADKERHRETAKETQPRKTFMHYNNDIHTITRMTQTHIWTHIFRHTHTQANGKSEKRACLSIQRCFRCIYNRDVAVVGGCSSEIQVLLSWRRNSSRWQRLGRRRGTSPRPMPKLRSDRQRGQATIMTSAGVHLTNRRLLCNPIH